MRRRGLPLAVLGILSVWGLSDQPLNQNSQSPGQAGKYSPFLSMQGPWDGTDQNDTTGTAGVSTSPRLPSSASSSQQEASSYQPSSLSVVAQRGTGKRAYEVVADEMLVQIRNTTARADVDRIVGALGSQVLEVAAYSGIYRLKLPTGKSLDAFQRDLQAYPEVRSAFPNAITEGAAAPLQYRPYEWFLDRIEFDAAWMAPPALGLVTVAVLDTGVAFEDFTSGTKVYVKSSDLNGTPIAPGYDFINGDAHPNDDHQHGTHIANIVSGQGATLGVAPGVGIMPVKVLGHDKRGTELALIEGLLHAVDNGADVINMSLSFGLGYFPSPGMEEAIRNAAEQNVIMAASVGNQGRAGVCYPAAFPDVLAVGATRLSRKATGTLYDQRAGYSNYGVGIDLMAPGGDLGYDMNLDGRPDGILAQTIMPGHPESLGYWFMAGTSQATAMVSGAAAWLLADGTSPALVSQTLRESASNMTRTDYDPMTGAGLIKLMAARNQAAAGTAPDEPIYYVNAIPRFVQDGSRVKQIVHVEVLDKNGRRAAGVRVGGAFYGSITSWTGTAITNANGAATFLSPSVVSSGKLIVGFQVAGVMPPGSNLHARTFQYHALSPAMAEVYTRLLVDPANDQSTLLFELTPGASVVSELLADVLDDYNMVRTFVYKPVGPGLRSGPLVIALNEAAVQELLNASSTLVTPLTFAFDTALGSGWGPISQLTGKRIDKSVASLGPATRYLILPMDPGMGKLVVGETYPVINAYAGQFLTENVIFGNGFASSALADGFASSSLGDGFASSSLGDGFASSSLGDGFASSSLGDGFASSSLGDGFASSSLGDGFASSSMGAGFASSSLGDGFASSSMGDDGGTAGMDSGTQTSSVVALPPLDESEGNDLGSLDVETAPTGTLPTVDEEPTPTP